MFAFIILLQCITVQNAVLIVDNQKQEVGPGTYCPAPYDVSLAKELTDKDTKIKTLEIQLASCDERMTRIENYWTKREDKVDQFYTGKIRELSTALEIQGNFWNKYGKTIIIGVILVAIASFTTYEIVK